MMKLYLKKQNLNLILKDLQMKNVLKLDEKKISLLEIPTGNPLIINFDSNNKIIECRYLDESRAKDLIVF